MNRILIPLFTLLLFVSVAIAETVTPIGDLKPGMSVTIKGEVTRILDEDEFRLKDKSGSVRVYTGWKNRFFARTGEKLTVRGFVDDDLKAYFRPEIYAFEIVREDGKAIKLHHD